ncbi:MAG: 3-deoxy-8-phosphooctulonate synthase [Proteobacteria bacterium]|nr:3-deoxy-8-phosphooctulonate synthase [Pseudomonadota bacterium]
MQKIIEVGSIKVGNELPLILIAGPCQIESREMALSTARELAYMSQKLGIEFIYKSSFDKANRTSLTGKRGIGIDSALQIFSEIKAEIGCPILTDVHEAEQCALAAEVADVLQVPAFLCRQTDMLLAAGRAGKVVNVKKGQFLAPWDMQNVAEKIASTGNNNIMLTERGVCFGYNRLVNDMRALPIMAKTGYPVVFDATHSIQEPSGMGGSSGGQREYVKVVARAAVAVGVAALFTETHPDPDNAYSDGPCMIHLHRMEEITKELMQFDAIAKQHSALY